MGRHKVPLDRKIVNFTIRLEPAVADRVCRYALRHKVSVYKLLGTVVTKVFAQRINSTAVDLTYPSESSSSAVVAARSSTGVSSAALDVAAAGRRCSSGVSD